MRRPTPEKSGGEEDPEAEPGGHREERPHRRRSTRHTQSSSGEGRSGASHRPNHHPRHTRHSSDSRIDHHRGSINYKSESRHHPRHYTSYSSAAPHDAPSSSASASEADPIPYRGGYMAPSTAPTIPEEDMFYAYRSDPRAPTSVGPWESISVAGLSPAQYQTYLAEATRTFKEPPGDAAATATADPGPAGQSRSHHGSAYSSPYRPASTPPYSYRHGAEVPWEDSAYTSAGGSRPTSSSSRTRRALPSYASHRYGQRQLQLHQQEDAAAFAPVELDPAYTMDSAYATMPGHHADDDGEVVEESDRMSFEVEEAEEEGGRRRVRGSRERRVTRSSRGTI